MHHVTKTVEKKNNTKTIKSERKANNLTNSTMCLVLIKAIKSVRLTHNFLPTTLVVQA